MDNKYYFQNNFLAIVTLDGVEDEINDKAITTDDPNQITISVVDFNCLCYNLYRIINSFYSYTPEKLYNKKYSLKIVKDNELVFEEKSVRKPTGYYLQVITCKDKYVKDTLNRELFRDNPNNSNINRVWVS